MTEKLTVSVDELAKLLGVSRPTAYALTHQTGFPSIRISDRRIIVPVDALRIWLAEQAKV
ncbi:MAG: helix-turn-helix domain-containing protein [Firmicutes bacterium]|nr:helix-turn-helix domain-containing protein [Bacillota bacterium]